MVWVLGAAGRARMGWQVLLHGGGRGWAGRYYCTGVQVLQRRDTGTTAGGYRYYGRGIQVLLQGRPGYHTTHTTAGWVLLTIYPMAACSMLTTPPPPPPLCPAFPPAELAKEFKCDVNSLPLSLDISWCATHHTPSTLPLSLFIS